MGPSYSCRHEAGRFSLVIDAFRSELAELIREIHGRGWSPGTGGNYSRVLSSEPLRLLITPSGIDKGQVTSESLLIVDEGGKVVEGEMSSSAETLLHVAIAQETDAQVILHTHTVWNTLASLTKGDGLKITGLEMVKGLEGVRTHEHEEIIPIFENSQDIASLAEDLRNLLRDKPKTHGILLRGHGLYTWGRSIFEARRHLEILEFLFEVTVRRQSLEQ